MNSITPSARALNRLLWTGALLLPVLCQAQAIPTYTITTVAGNGTSGFSGDGSTATSAMLAGSFGVALDSSGNLYIADQFNNRVRKVTPDGTISTFAGKGTAAYSGDKGSATSAELNNPQGVAVDSSGNVYIADTANHVVRKVTGGTITTVAGINIPGYGGDGAGATGALLANPTALAIDSSGNLYIADTSNNVIRKVTSSGGISTVAGVGRASSGGDGGPANQAGLNNPEGVAVDAAGNIYIADTLNRRIRKVTAADGTIKTIAGTGILGFSGDGAAATLAAISNPDGVAVDGAGNVFIADSFNNRIRLVLANGNITTVAGTRTAGYSGDGGVATNAQLRTPSSLALSSKGNIYVGDNQNNAVRLLTLNAQVGNLPVITAGGVVSAGAFGGFTSAAPGSWIEIYGSNLATGTRSWTGSDFKGVVAPLSLDGTQVTIGGQQAAVDFISPGQVNAQIPSSVGFGPQPVTVTTGVGASAAVNINVNVTQPGLLAPPSFVIGGKQYLGATFPDGVTYVLPTGAIPGLTSRPARPGETIILYGVGFGPVTPTIASGQIVQQSNTVSSPVQILFGQSSATLSYSGLAPNAVGLYQFNVTVPNVAASDAVPVTFSLGGVPGTQTLYTAIQN